jgi:hypothetical protein
MDQHRESLASIDSKDKATERSEQVGATASNSRHDSHPTDIYLQDLN